ncbi:hypothetical protein G3I40_03440 [Streptomyces sp. SID14478]|uniref:hypothetical protein n=1 Tax=Streptomyces sp. SID14478 TaxID=2706073 RepID=UPI0013DBF517|nr:hypothetical protein [Streptomyces sp. SID14478]NEB74294.1 hypothetical protein [Streptomyces sp. SID14478]
MSPSRDVVGISDLDVMADALANVIAGEPVEDALRAFPAAASPLAVSILLRAMNRADPQAADRIRVFCQVPTARFGAHAATSNPQHPADQEEQQ